MAYDLTDYLNIENRPADYIPLTEFTPVMKCAVVSLIHEDNTKPEDIPYITAPMACIIDRLSEGETLKAACDKLNLPTVRHVVWLKQNILYAKAYELIKLAQAEEVEQVVWKNALSGSTATSIERMFALKSRKQEYKDNAQIPGDTNISIRVTLEGNEIPTTLIEAESEEVK